MEKLVSHVIFGKKKRFTLMIMVWEDSGDVVDVRDIPSDPMTHFAPFYCIRAVGGWFGRRGDADRFSVPITAAFCMEFPFVFHRTLRDSCGSIMEGGLTPGGAGTTGDQGRQVRGSVMLNVSCAGDTRVFPRGRDRKEYAAEVAFETRRLQVALAEKLRVGREGGAVFTLGLTLIPDWVWRINMFTPYYNHDVGAMRVKDEWVAFNRETRTYEITEFMPTAVVCRSAYGTSNADQVKEKLRRNEAPPGKPRFAEFTMREKLKFKNQMIMRCPWCWNPLARGWCLCPVCWTTFVILGFLEPALYSRLSSHLGLLEMNCKREAERMAACYIARNGQKNGRQLVGQGIIMAMKWYVKWRNGTLEVAAGKAQRGMAPLIPGALCRRWTPISVQDDIPDLALTGGAGTTGNAEKEADLAFQCAVRKELLEDLAMDPTLTHESYQGQAGDNKEGTNALRKATVDRVMIAIFGKINVSISEINKMAAEGTANLAVVKRSADYKLAREAKEHMAEAERQKKFYMNLTPEPGSGSGGAGSTAPDADAASPEGGAGSTPTASGVSPGVGQMIQASLRFGYERGGAQRPSPKLGADSPGVVPPESMTLPHGVTDAPFATLEGGKAKGLGKDAGEVREWLAPSKGKDKGKGKREESRPPQKGQSGEGKGKRDESRPPSQRRGLADPTWGLPYYQYTGDWTNGCTYCGSWYHYKRDCVKCNYCEWWGHYAFECPAKGKGKGLGRGGAAAGKGRGAGTTPSPQQQKGSGGKGDGDDEEMPPPPAAFSVWAPSLAGSDPSASSSSSRAPPAAKFGDDFADARCSSRGVFKPRRSSEEEPPASRRRTEPSVPDLANRSDTQSRTLGIGAERRTPSQKAAAVQEQMRESRRAKAAAEQAKAKSTQGSGRRDSTRTPPPPKGRPTSEGSGRGSGSDRSGRGSGSGGHRRY